MHLTDVVRQMMPTIEALRRGMEQWATERYEQLYTAVANNEDLPGYLDDAQRVRVFVCLRTGLQPSEFDGLTILERVPFLERTAEALGIDTYNFEDDDGTVAASSRPRFKSPPCKKCGGKTHVTKTTGATRRIECRHEDCGHVWTATKS